MIDHIIWDWNGTLLDDVQFCIDITNGLLRENHLPAMDTLEAYHRVFTFPVSEYYDTIGLGGERFRETGSKWMDTYMKNESRCPLRSDAVAVCDLFHAHNFHQVVISASKLSNLKLQMEERSFCPYFDPPRGLGDIYAGSKIEIALDWMKTSKAKKENTLLIGDTLHDKDVADALSCRCILVEGGHQSREKLLSAGVPVASSLTHAAQMVLSMHSR